MNADFELGNKTISYALSFLAWGVSVAIAWSCSTLLMGIVMFIIMSIVLGLLSAVAHVVLIMKLPVSTTESIGHTVGSLSARFTNLFARKVSA